MPGHLAEEHVAHLDERLLARARRLWLAGGIELDRRRAQREAAKLASNLEWGAKHLQKKAANSGRSSHPG